MLRVEMNWNRFLEGKEPLERPLHGYKKDKKFNYSYTFLDGFEFSKGMFLNKLFTRGFNNKKQWKCEGKKSMELVKKIILNCSYGFFALKTKDRDDINIFFNNDNGLFFIITI